MLGGIFLASYSYFEGSPVGDLFSFLEQAGVFSYVLPFLLVFSIIFGILIKVKVFEENKSLNAIISLVVALMAMQSNMVSVFFAEISPRLGVGLIVILVLLILLGLFIPDEGWVTYVFFGVAVLIVGIILVNTAGSLGWSSGYWWQDNWTWIVGLVVFAVILAMIVGASRPPSGAKSPLTKIIKDLSS